MSSIATNHPAPAPLSRGERRKLRKKGEEDLAKGVGATVAGGVVAKKSVPMVHGRTALYYGGRKGSKERLRAGGLRTRAAIGDAGGITAAFTDAATNEASKDLAFSTRHKTMASSYARQKGLADTWMRRHPGATREEALRRIRTDPFYNLRLQLPGSAGGEVTKMKVPLWRLRQEGRIVANPEVKSLADRHQALYKIFGVPRKASEILSSAMVGELGGNYAIQGGIGPEYVRGSPNYQKITLKEIGEYARARPRTFAAGVGLTGLGAAGLLYGGKKLHSSYTTKKRLAKKSRLTKKGSIPQHPENTVSYNEKIAAYEFAAERMELEKRAEYLADTYGTSEGYLPEPFMVAFHQIEMEKEAVMSALGGRIATGVTNLAGKAPAGGKLMQKGTQLGRFLGRHEKAVGIGATGLAGAGAFGVGRMSKRRNQQG